MNRKQEYDVQLTTLAYGGDALGRLPDGRAVFVPFSLPGEKVRIQLVQEKRGHAHAKLLDVLEVSPERISPRCPHYTICGGCHYQHLDYAAQLAAKKGILIEQLERIGGLRDIPSPSIIASPQAWNYRNHVQFHQAMDGSLGFQVANSKQVVPISECHLPETALNEIWPLIDLEPLPSVERINLRLGADQDVMLILESSQPQAFDFSVEDLPISAVHLGPGGAVVLAGSDHLTINLLDKQFQVSPASFFQVNTLQAARIVEHLLQNLRLDQSSTVLDVYCGVGLFSAFLAPKVKRLVGIEVSPSACEDFEVNLDEYDHVELYEASAEKVLCSQNFQPDVLVVDPPRAGLGQRTLDGVLAQEAKQIAYVSCDPSTLGRDMKRLTSGGYRPYQITMFDLFPQTYHVECVVLMSKD